ncbi:unnamed protein product [Caenorhabditis sp. 36 PRJEB53466]|nr:unnamed protein product [Caenorhabditis sp. 36 PRJEB53466]
MDVHFERDDADCTLGVKKASEGCYVLKDAVLVEYKVNGQLAGKIKAPVEGVVTYAQGLDPKVALSKGQLIARIADCTHAIVIKDMCATCGKDLRERGGRAGQRTEQSTANVSMIHHVPELIVSDSLAQELGSADESNLINTRKLVLLVDLDQTIIHTSDRPMTVDTDKHKDITKYTLHQRLYTTKLRPHTTEFLHKMAQMYEMHIVTYGQRQYAHQIAKILDPDERIFGHRILSRDELFSAQHKTRNLKALFPCGDNLVVIIDDRADVWQYSDALIQIKPYRFFREVGDINAPKGADRKEHRMPSEIEDDAHEDRVLEEIERVLTNIHDKYYEKYDLRPHNDSVPLLDVKEVIKAERRKVLDGCVICFSGIVPQGQKLEHTDIYRLCQQFGASIVPDVTEEVTHVVAARYGTQKVHQAVRLEKHVVNVQWVFACVEKWIKADEKVHEVTKDSTPPEGRPQGSKYVNVDLGNDLANMDTIGKAQMAEMNAEIDEAMSDEEEDEDENEEEDGDDGDDDDEEEEENGKKSEESAENEPKPEEKRGKKRAHCPEEEWESDKEEEEDDEDPPLSYKALLSRSRKEGRIVPEEDEQDVFDVDDEKGHVSVTGNDEDGEKEEEEDVEDEEKDEDEQETDDDDEFEDMAALVERQISETADDRANDNEPL